MRVVTLVVEKNERERKLLCDRLQKIYPEMQIEAAGSSREALRIIHNRRATDAESVDLLIINVALESDDDAWQVAQSAQKTDGTMKVIVYFAYWGNSARRYDIEAFLNPFAVIVNDERIAFRTEVAKHVGRAIQARQVEREAALLHRHFDRRLYEHLTRDPKALDLSRRIVTVVFWDIRGFTALCEAIPTTHVIGFFLKEYFDCAVRAIYDHGGILDKFIGDGVMALFGAFDNPRKEDQIQSSACAACDAALRLRAEFNSLVPDWFRVFEQHTHQDLTERRHQTFGLGCGIETGEVVIGRLATSDRDEFTAVGPMVNRASRIESVALREQIIVGQSTKGRVDQWFEFGERITRRLPGGVRGKVVLYPLERRRSVAEASAPPVTDLLLSPVMR